MSSHHFVKEEQEPALFIDKLSGTYGELVGQLLEWSPYVVVAETEVAFFEAMGYKFDLLTSSGNEEAPLQDSVNVLRSPKDEAFMAVLGHLKARGQRSVNVLTSADRLMDLAQQALAFKVGVVFFTAERKYLLFEGKIFTKWLPGGSELMISTLIPDTVIHSVGFLKNVRGEKVDDPQSLLVNQEGFTSIETNGPLLISEALTL